MKIRSLVVILCSALLLGGCAKESCESVPQVSHTLLIYMAADNNLGYADDADNLAKMYDAVGRSALNGGRLVVYHDPLNGTPSLFEIFKGRSGKAEKRVIKNYEEHNSASAQTMGAVIADLRTSTPSLSYGMILWSHGTGWLPKNSPYGYINNYSPSAFLQSDAIRDPYRVITMPRTRAFGQDGSQWMELSDLAQAMPDGMFEYILFDACFMGEAEVAYALRNKTHYLMASSAEIIAEGMPYDLILSECFSGRYQSVCERYFNYYNSKQGDYRSATIALYDCSQMNALAESVAPIIDRFRSQIPGLDISNIQRFDRNRNHTMFDMQNVVATLIPDQNDLIRTQFEQQLSRTVICKYNTEWMFGSFQVKTFCGISMYLPRAQYTDLNPDYENTEWCKTIYKN